MVRLHSTDAADILENMPPDEAADVMGELSAAGRDSVLAQMEISEANDVRELLAYPPERAGGRRTTGFLAIRQGMTVDQALRALREEAGRAEVQSYVYVLDDRQRLVGVAPLHDLVVSRADRPITEITKHDVVTVRAADDQEVAPRRLQGTHLLPLPVVNAHGRLLRLVPPTDLAAARP